MARLSPISAALFLGVICLSTASARAVERDEFDDARSPTHFVLASEHLTLTLKGELEVELHDLEGKGGPGFDSATDTLTIGTRSPFVELDAFWLALRLGFGHGLAVNSVLEFSTTGARLGAVWADWRITAPCWLSHHVELGYALPIAAVDRRTERYPLLATQFWRSPEMHLAWEGRFLPDGPVTVDLGLSLGFMRPLHLMGVQDSTAQTGTINVLAAGPAEPFSGNGPVGGGRLKLSAFGAFVEVYGFLGSLSDEAGTDVLRSAFSSYRNLPGYDEETGGSHAYHWVGGRVGYVDHGVYVWAEGVLSKEGLLSRQGFYVQASVAIPLGLEVFLHTIEPLVRFERAHIEGSTEVLSSGRALRSPALIDAVAWDWEVWTAAVALSVYRDLVLVRAEYALLFEDNGVPGLGTPTEPFRNDEFTLQIQLRF
ncbi:MAG: hypothetical protein ACPGU1_10970 [Myxococcota bacterium]